MSIIRGLLFFFRRFPDSDNPPQADPHNNQVRVVGKRAMSLSTWGQVTVPNIEGIWSGVVQEGVKHTHLPPCQVACLD